MTMSRARFERIYSGMNAAAKKVYGATPMRDSWDHAQICSELWRCGMNSDPRVVLGCLSTLARAGLVNEVERGKFRREEVKDPVLSATAMKEEEMATASKGKAVQVVTAAQAKESAIDVLGALAARAATIANLVKELSSDIGDAAIEIQSELENNDADMQKFKQLQSLLKSIG